jgi:hypothetical protein
MPRLKPSIVWRRWLCRARRASPITVALAVALPAGAALSLSYHAQRAPLTRRAAIRAVLQDPRVVKGLAHTHWDTATVSPVDGQLERLTLFAGPRIVAQFAIQRNGTVTQGVDFTRMPVPYGNRLAFQPTMLIGLGILFALMAGVAPLRRIRNLDAAAALTLLAPIVLLQHRFLDASVLASIPGLVYLTLRCAWNGFGRAAAAQPSTPLFEQLTANWEQPQRNRLLKIVLVALMLVFVMVGVSSIDAVDVIYAVMEGATKVIHGVLPYGHMPGDVIHGDTYPILSYALYVPLAWIAPVRSTWDSVDPALGIAVLAAFASMAAVFRASAGARRDRRVAASEHDRDPRRSPEAEARGLRAALTWLAFPPLLITVSTGTTDVALAAMLVFAVVLWRRPAASTGLIAAAGWFKLAPFALLPIWLAPLRGRRLLGALAALGTVSGAMLCLVIALGGVGGLSQMLHALSFQFSRGSPQSIWAVLGIDRLQPLAQACVLGMIAAAAARLHRDPELAPDRARMAALTAAILLGLQLAANYWAFLYLVWVVPLLGLSLLAQVPRTEVIEVSRVEDRVPQLVPATT